MLYHILWASLVAHQGKIPPANVGDAGSIPGWGRFLGEGNATHSSILAWEIPWTEGAWWAIVNGATEELDMT